VYAINTYLNNSAQGQPTRQAIVIPAIILILLWIGAFFIA
jgi:hypothetical protein